jgi:hypothetical protein
MNQLFAAYDIQVYTMTTERRSHLIHQKYVDEAEWEPWKEAARVQRESPHLLQSHPITPQAARRGGNQSSSVWNGFSVSKLGRGPKLQTTHLA